MAVLIVVAVVCFSAGVFACSRWLPELADGPVGSIAFFVICGLSGAAVGLVGINVDSTVRGLERTGLGGGGSFSQSLETVVVTDGLVAILRDAGTVAGLALVAYLLAPKRQGEPEPPALPQL